MQRTEHQETLNFNLNLKSKIFDIFQQRMEWAYRKYMVFFMRVIQKLSNKLKSKCVLFFLYALSVISKNF